MTKNSNLDFVQEVFIALAETKNIPLTELKTGWDEEREHHEWNLDYNTSLESDVEEQSRKMMLYFKLHSAAINDHDLNTGQAALAHAAIYAQNLRNIFDSIYAECYKVIRDDQRFQWPEMDENYRIPERYDHMLST